MPNIKSAIKRVRVSETKALQNRMIKSKVRTAVKKLNVQIAQNPADAAANYGATVSELDKAVIKGVVTKNAANRKKARLAKAIRKASAK